MLYVNRSGYYDYACQEYAGAAKKPPRVRHPSLLTYNFFHIRLMMAMLHWLRQVLIDFEYFEYKFANWQHRYLHMAGIEHLRVYT